MPTSRAAFHAEDEARLKAHLLPIMLDHVNAGRPSLQRLVGLASHGPQRLFGIRRKGRIAVG